MSFASPSLPSEPTGPRRRRLARRLWWAVLVVAGVFLAGLIVLFNFSLEITPHLGYGIAATPAAPLNFHARQDLAFYLHPFNNIRLDYAVHAAGYLLIFLLTQWLFLMPRGSWRINLSGESRPMKRAVIVAALMAMLLSAGLLATLAEWPFPAKVATDLPTLWMRLTAMPNERAQNFRLVWLVMLGLWIFWGAAFWFYFRRAERMSMLAGLFRFLLAGSLLELLIAAPAHAWIARKEECYCARGSYTGLVFGGTVLLWLFGPGLFFLFLREKRRREPLA